jgi:ATP-dependent helicase STH1/SNF2
MPLGLDPIALGQERERRIRNLVAHRITQLDALPACLPMEKDENIGLDANSISEMRSSKPATKIRALIELKSLRMLEKQRRLRAEVVSSMKLATTLQTAVSRTDYRRAKKPSLREIRVTERMERQQRLEREKKEKQKQLEHLNSMLQHGRDMLAVRKQQVQKQMKLGRAVLHWHSTIEKEEQKRQERLTRERIKALKVCSTIQLSSI